MASRAVDRRDAIVSAAYRCIASNGYERTSTAQMCAAAGVSSGTFFHYFPTKVAVLVAVLHRDLDRIRHSMDDLGVLAATDASAALTRWCESVIDDASSADLPGFIAALGTVPDHPDVTEAIAAETAIVHAGLVEVVSAGQRQQSIRGDRSSESLALWLQILSDGVFHHVLQSGHPPVEQLRRELIDAATRLVAATPSS
ncbi:TetR/AcrR family transcriptional regulator [Rhodococcoides fascians]|uniref:TetR/AcrR family transcriptional regulator n=1 Tax=Rhodococcoides fascians TaxID=1828 RepID=UPI0006915B3B|nr:TetR/AcrR family transcriptional regulator [Rhodococcus fascians]